MPVVVVALAAESFIAAAGAYAAATTVAGMVLAGATMVGAALTVVGTVTGNQKLTKIGAIVGLVGGVGSMLSSGADAAGAEAAAATADGGTSGLDTAGGATSDAGGAIPAIDGTTGATTTGAQTFPVDVPGADAVSTVPGTGTGMLDSTASAASTAAPVSGVPVTADTGMLGSADPGALPDPLAPAVSKTSALDTGSTVTGQNAAATGQTGDAFVPGSSVNADMSMPQTQMPLGTGSLAADPSTMQQLGAWVKANPELAKMALSAGSAAVGGLVPSAKDKVMMDAYRAQATQTAAQTDALKRKAAWGAGRTTY